jgi:hypothetical protein
LPSRPVGALGPGRASAPSDRAIEIWAPPCYTLAAFSLSETAPVERCGCQRFRHSRLRMEMHRIDTDHEKR